MSKNARKVADVVGPKSRGKSTVYLNTNSGKFYAHVRGGNSVEADTLPECKKLAEAELDRVGVVEWRQVILIKRSTAGKRAFDDDADVEGLGTNYEYGVRDVRYMKLCATVDVDFYRCELANVGKSDVLRRPFLVDGLSDYQRNDVEASGYRVKERKATMARENAERRAASKDFDDPHILDDFVEVPYSDETWAALLEVRKAVGRLGTQLRAILLGGKPEALAALVARISPPALPAPKKAKRRPLKRKDQRDCPDCGDPLVEDHNCPGVNAEGSGYPKGASLEPTTPEAFDEDDDLPRFDPVSDDGEPDEVEA